MQLHRTCLREAVFVAVHSCQVPRLPHQPAPNGMHHDDTVIVGLYHVIQWLTLTQHHASVYLLNKLRGLRHLQLLHVLVGALPVGKMVVQLRERQHPQKGTHRAACRRQLVNHLALTLAPVHDPAHLTAWLRHRDHQAPPPQEAMVIHADDTMLQHQIAHWEVPDHVAVVLAPTSWEILATLLVEVLRVAVSVDG